MIAIFDVEAKATACIASIQAYLILNRDGYNADRWSMHNKSESAELWAVSLPPELAEITGEIELVEQYPEGWRKPVEMT